MGFSTAPQDAEVKFMARAIQLARRGIGLASPNPMVGAVVVKSGRIVGVGYHRGVGHPHAEAVAIEAAGKRAKGADLYVNLEPCGHHGRTPPCTDAIVAAGIRRVWVAIRDPNSLVNGRGIAALRRKAVDVEVGLLAEKAAHLNEFYLKRMMTGRPFVVAKLAATLDGRIATSSGESRWISGPEARKVGHRLRQQVDAIVVGVRTVIADDPELTVRMGARRPRHPIRIVLDSSLRIPRRARVLDISSGAATIVACRKSADPARIKRMKERGIEVWPLRVDSEKRVSFPAFLRRVEEAGIGSVLIEGGGRVVASALKAKLVDKLIVFLAPKLLGDGARAAVGDLGIERVARAHVLCDLKSRRVGKDLMVESYPMTVSGEEICSQDWWKKLAG